MLTENARPRYTINITGAGKGSYQKVKKVLKDHGIFEPANCSYTKPEKTFVLEWPGGVSIEPLRDALKALDLELCSAEVRGADEEGKVDLIDAAGLAISHESQLLSLESRVENMDRTLFNGLRGLVMLIDNLEKGVNPQNTPEERARALVQVREIVDVMQESLT